jgi:hypothetical protein
MFDTIETFYMTAQLNSLGDFFVAKAIRIGKQSPMTLLAANRCLAVSVAVSGICFDFN